MHGLIAKESADEVNQGRPPAWAQVPRIGHMDEAAIRKNVLAVVLVEGAAVVEGFAAFKLDFAGGKFKVHGYLPMRLGSDSEKGRNAALILNRRKGCEPGDKSRGISAAERKLRF